MIEANRFLVLAASFRLCGIAGCVTHFKVRFSWQQFLLHIRKELFA